MLLTLTITAATLSWFSFIVWYSIRAKWWKSLLGRNTFAVSLVLFAILLRLTVLRWWPTAHEHDFWGIVIYVLATLLAIQRIWFVEKSQREANALRQMGYNRRKTD